MGKRLKKTLIKLLFNNTVRKSGESYPAEAVLYIRNYLVEAKDSVSGEYRVKYGTRTITANAFENCDKLTSVIIPDTIASVGNHAFEGCSSLTDVYYTGTEEQWAAIDIFSDNSHLTNATIHYNYVPEE